VKQECNHGWAGWVGMIARKSRDDLERFFEKFHLLEVIRVLRGNFTHLEWFLAEASRLKEITLAAPVQEVIDRICVAQDDSAAHLDGITLLEDRLGAFRQYTSCASLQSLTLQLAFNPAGPQEPITLPELPLLEHLDLRTLVHPGNIRFPAPSPSL
ncbi:unnamed protein product, partial [Polarella glacialis]